ncbi:MAG: serine hydrolase, partial [Oscillospiraceae bacterium]
ADAVYSIERGTTHIALSEGEVIPVEDLLHATMIESANDAANGLAEYVSGSLEAFVELMNKRAAEAGATDSHFVNAHGLHDAKHVTTAYDMAMITKWALGIDGFRELFGATEYTIAPTNKQPKQRRFGTHDHMLVESAYSYPGAKGGKLGWTPEAQHTLVTLAERDGLELICVVLKTKDQYEKYEDTAALLDQCFENYSTALFEGSRFAHQPIPVYAAAGEQVATVTLLPQDVRIARPSTLAKADISAVLAV